METEKIVIENEVDKAPKNKKKQIFSTLLIIASIALVVYVIWSSLKGDASGAQVASFGTVFATWMDNWVFLVIAFGLYFLAQIFESLKYLLMIRKKTGTTNFRISLKTTIIGKYYDNITPLASGGQPFQIFYLKKAGLTAGQAGALPIISFFLSRLGFVILCVGAFIIVPISMVTDGIRILAYVGASITILVPLLIILLSIFPKAIMKIIDGFIHLLAKMKIVRNEEKQLNNVHNTINSYSESIREFKDAKLILVICLVFSMLTHLALTSIPFFVILASGESASYVQCVALAFFAYASVTFIPTPGTAGAAEYSFKMIFEQFILNAGYLVFGMLLWRFITFYLIIIVGLILVIVGNINKKKAVKIKQKIENVIERVDEETDDEFSVALFNDNFYPIIDGVVKVVDNYAIELNKKHVRTIVIAPKSKNYVEEKRGYEVVRTPSMRVPKIEYPMARPKRSKKLKDRISEGKITLYHAHSPFVMGHYAVKMARRNHVPVIATLHSKYYDDFLTMSKSKFIAKQGVKYVVNFLNKCDAVWTVSESTAETLRGYGYKGKITVMPNGTNFVAPSNPSKLIEDAKTAYGINKDDRVLLFVGHLIWQKNLKLILDTFESLHKKDSRYKLLLVGEGGNEKAVKSYAEKKGLLEKGVQFLGKIAQMEQLQGIYGASDLFFFPSTYDTFGIVVCEAATMKVPSLLIKGSNAAENMKDNDNGFLAEENVESLTKRIEEIFSQPKLMKQVGEKAQETLPNSWSDIAKKVRREYRKVLKEYYEKESE